MHTVHCVSEKRHSFFCDIFVISSDFAYSWQKRTTDNLKEIFCTAHHANLVLHVRAVPCKNLQLDNAPVHRAHDKLVLLIWPRDKLWPPNYPDLNPVDSGVMQELVYRTPVFGVADLKPRLVAA